MSLFFGNYNKEGKGVNKGEQENVFAIFFEKFWYFSKVNLVYSVYLIPAYIIIGALVSIVVMGFSEDIVSYLNIQNDIYENILYINLYTTFIVMNIIVSVFGLGPATMGFSFAMNKYAKEEHLWIFDEMKTAVKNNFINGIKMIVVDFIIISLIVIALIQYTKMGGMFVYMNFVVLCIFLMYMLTHLYVYPLAVTKNEPIRNIIKKAFVLAMGELPTSLLLLTFTLLVHFILPIAVTILFGKTFVLLLLIFYVLEITILQSLTGFVTGYFVNKIMIKYSLNID